MKLMAETLFYEYRGPFFVPARLHGYRGRVGNLDVIELRRSSKFLPYVLRMECQVTTKEQAERYDAEARQLASDLNIVWAYVALVPLFPKRIMLRLSGSPDDWHTNFKKLKSTRPIKPLSPRTNIGGVRDGYSEQSGYGADFHGRQFGVNFCLVVVRGETILFFRQAPRSLGGFLPSLGF